VALMGIAAFMVRIHRDWERRPPIATSPASMPPAKEGTAGGAAPAAPVTISPHDGADGGAVPMAAVPVGIAGVVETLRSRALTIPVRGLDAAALVPSFSQARGERVHEALDIMAAAGTAVVAVEDGTVAKLFTSKAGGLTLYQFDPSQSVAYYYAHLQGYAPGVVEGATVTRGQVIGYVGSTGNASPTAPHLHFAIFVLGPEKHWWQGTAIDPYRVFK
jgi:murein DD-endopeptidase MepM/ murein hydrolase activator NlpD